MGATTTVMSTTSVPESVLKKRETQEKIGAEKAAAAEVAKQARKEKRIQVYKNAEKYVKEYRAIAKQRVRMHRQAKAAGNHFVDGEAKLMFVVRIRGLADMHPKTKKILQLMRLRQMNMGVFMKASKPALEMIKRVEPYLSYGYPSLKTVRDLVHEIVTVGPKFREANNFLWPFKLRPAKGGQAKKRKGYCEGGQAGNREDQMNNLIQKML